MPVDKEFLSRLQVGDIIVYLARLEDGPANPDKEWRGKVLRVYADEPRLPDHVGVESLEPGEEGLTELVYPQQILRKEGGQIEDWRNHQPENYLLPDTSMVRLP